MAQGVFGLRNLDAGDHGARSCIWNPGYSRAQTESVANLILALVPMAPRKSRSNDACFDRHQIWRHLPDETGRLTVTFDSKIGTAPKCLHWCRLFLQLRSGNTSISVDYGVNPGPLIDGTQYALTTNALANGGCA